MIARNNAATTYEIDKQREREREQEETTRIIRASNDLDNTCRNVRSRLNTTRWFSFANEPCFELFVTGFEGSVALARICTRDLLNMSLFIPSFPFVV